MFVYRFVPAFVYVIGGKRRKWESSAKEQKTESSAKEQKMGIINFKEKATTILRTRTLTSPSKERKSGITHIICLLFFADDSRLLMFVLSPLIPVFCSFEENSRFLFFRRIFPFSVLSKCIPVFCIFSVYSRFLFFRSVFPFSVLPKRIPIFCSFDL